jgi:lysozyme
VNVATLAAALIRVFEGCRLTAYQDSGGIWTIGFGHTGPDIKEGLTITYVQALMALEFDAKPLLALVENEPMQAAAAYVSFGYNCGRSALELVLEGKIKLEAYGLHDKHGNVLPGLVARRNLEAALIASVAPVTA